MESGLRSTSISSLSTLAWIPSGSTDLCIAEWCSRSLTISSSSSGVWVLKEQEVLLLDTEVKKKSQPFLILCQYIPCFIPQRVEVLLSAPFTSIIFAAKSELRTLDTAFIKVC